MNLNVTIPYEDFVKMGADAADKEAVIGLINAKFPDAECQVLAIKAVLGLIEEEEEPEPEPESPEDGADEEENNDGLL